MTTQLDEALKQQNLGEIFNICFEKSKSPMQNSSWKDFDFSEMSLNLSLIYGYYPLTVQLLERGATPDKNTLLCALFSDSNNPMPIQFNSEYFNTIIDYLLARGVNTSNALQHLPFAYQPNYLLQKIDPQCQCSVSSAAAALRYAEAHLTFLNQYGNFSGLRKRVEQNSSWQGKKQATVVEDLKDKSVDFGSSDRKKKRHADETAWDSVPDESDFFTEIERSSLSFFSRPPRHSSPKIKANSDSEIEMDDESYQDIDLSETDSDNTPSPAPNPWFRPLVITAAPAAQNTPVTVVPNIILTIDTDDDSHGTDLSVNHF